MIALKKIKILPDFKIHCFFNNGKEKILDVKPILKGTKGEKILREDIFKTANIGETGELYWANMDVITETNGQIVPCNYDMCPDFVYIESESV